MHVKFRFDRATVLLVLGTLLGLFHLYTAFFGLFPTSTQRGLHWGTLGIMAFMTHPLGDWTKPFRLLKITVDIIIIGLFATASAYLLLTWEANAFRIGAPPFIEVFFGCAMILLTLEAARRTSGLVLPLISFLFLAYAMAGPYFPGILRRHSGHYRGLFHKEDLWHS